MTTSANGDDLEADLGSLSDDDWRDGHVRLAGTGVPDDELEHIWDPALDGDDLIPSEERVSG